MKVSFCPLDELYFCSSPATAICAGIGTLSYLKLKDWQPIHSRAALDLPDRSTLEKTLPPDPQQGSLLSSEGTLDEGWRLSKEELSIGMIPLVLSYEVEGLVSST